MIDGASDRLTTAIEAAERGATILRDNFQSNVNFERKSETDLVSEVDKKAERAIKKYLQSRHGDHSFFAEESGREGSSSHRWIIDPLDGTHNYLRRFPHYCVSVAYEVDEDVLIGVVNYPERGEVYAAERGDGAYCNGEPLSVTDAQTLSESYIGMGISPPTATDDRFLTMFRKLFRDERPLGIRRLGAGAADLSFVSKGIFDGFFDKHTSPWDVAAGALIVKEAGGTVTDLQGDPIDFGVGEREVNILATNGNIHKEMLGLYSDPATQQR